MGRQQWNDDTISQKIEFGNNQTKEVRRPQWSPKY